MAQRSPSPPDPWVEFAEPAEILPYVNKRLTLNLLIQGAASHGYLTSHHLVHEQLEALRPGLTSLYDRITISAHLNHWIGDGCLFFGRPRRFWMSVAHPTHPFHRHPLLVAHGELLAEETRKHLIARAKVKDVSTIPGVHFAQAIKLMVQLVMAEDGLDAPLTTLAVHVATCVWGFDERRLDAQITRDLEFGRIREPRTRLGRKFRKAAAGWSGVQSRKGELRVVAKALFWPLLSHELTKGICELICLHGLCDLGKQEYADVVGYADHIEYEIPMLQAGAELWRRFLAVIPPGQSLPHMLMHVARLEPDMLERLMMNVVEAPSEARRVLEQPPFHAE